MAPSTDTHRNTKCVNMMHDTNQMVFFVQGIHMVLLLPGKLPRLTEKVVRVVQICRTWTGIENYQLAKSWFLD